ncbi:MAG: NAD(P)-binding protein [Spirochaetes bacterium]|nr:NAD(P)-binding protein [Spirochaetota bacterium]
MPKYRIPQLKLPLNHSRDAIEKKICAILGTKPDSLVSWKVVKKSFDAREKTEIRVIYAVVAELNKAIKSDLETRDWALVTDEEPYVFPVSRTASSTASRPMIVGAGPAGLFCALLLAENGFAPLVLERGEDAETRLEVVQDFWESGRLKPDSNMQFGEGGAGTFSDGKLNTTVGDKYHLNAKILGEFIEAGAPPEIASMNKPHIGTDYLVRVVRNIRKKIESLGGAVVFNAKATAFEIEKGKVKAVFVNDIERIETSVLVLAIGHSARDTFEILSHSPVSMAQKPFAIGLRIEHPQEMIQRSQFGAFWNHPALPAADYKLTYQSSSGRGVYSFCMCPGGFVVNSSSEPGMVACNGMSDFARDARNANSAIVVAVRTEDFGSQDIMAGIEFQRRWERAAFTAANPGGGFAMPVQRFGDFLVGRLSTGFMSIRPCAKGAFALSDLNPCLPDFVTTALKEGILNFDRKIKGFAHPDALLTGVETRTSSPIRILRDENFQSSIEGIFPCGEGGGYSGGIMSSAMDGIRVAEAVAKVWR